MLTMNSVRPWCRSAARSVRASRYACVARWAALVQILRPRTRQPPASLTANVRTDARSEPASGSLMPRQNTKSAEMIPGRISACSRGLPCRRTDGPIWRSPIQCAATGAPARSGSSVTASRATFGRPRPPQETGQVSPISPSDASSRLNSGSNPRSQLSLRGTYRPSARQRPVSSRTCWRSDATSPAGAGFIGRVISINLQGEEALIDELRGGGVTEVLLQEDAGGVRLLTLNRPEARNALNSPLVEALYHALLAADAHDQVRVLVLTGADPAFCAGIDLKEAARVIDAT